MTVYLDLVWALNFLFDSLLLYLTAIILKRSFKLWRVFLGGFIGSFIILLTFSPFSIYAGHPFVKLLFSLLMIVAVFGYKRFRYFLQGLFTFYLLTFLIGGGLVGVHYFLQFSPDLSASVLIGSIQGFGDPISWLFVLLGFPIAWHFSRKSLDQLEMTKITYEEIVDVHLKIARTEWHLRGLIDSGNQLYDPLSKAPVMIVSITRKYDDLPESLCAAVREPEKIISGETEIPDEWRNKIRFIPYKVVGQEHQILLAVKSDEIRIKVKDEWLTVQKGLVSFTEQTLSSDDLFHCIVHPKMLTGLKKTVAGQGLPQGG